jgi:hypothetical protein
VQLGQRRRGAHRDQLGAMEASAAARAQAAQRDKVRQRAGSHCKARELQAVKARAGVAQQRA